MKKEIFHAGNGGDRRCAVRRMLSRLALIGIAFFLLAAAMPAGAASEEATLKDGWQFDADIYLWGASISGRTPGGDDIDVSFHDILQNLDLAFMGGLGARKGKWSLMTDAIYMKLDHENNGQITASVGPSGEEVNVPVDATFKLQSWVVTGAVGYNVLDFEKIVMDVLAGARYLWLKPELDLDVTGPLQPRQRHISDSGNVWDGIVGLRGKVNLDKRWYVPYYADLGAGGSIFTWQAMTGVGYKISRVVDVVAAYRYLYWKFKDNDVLDKMSLGGPVLGMRFSF